MAIILNDNIDNRSPKALDDRQHVADITARNALDPNYRHAGMLVYVDSQKVFYYLDVQDGDDFSDNTKWRTLGGLGEVEVAYVDPAGGDDATGTLFSPANKFSTIRGACGAFTKSIAYVLMEDGGAFVETGNIFEELSSTVRILSITGNAASIATDDDRPFQLANTGVEEFTFDTLVGTGAINYNFNGFGVLFNIETSPVQKARIRVGDITFASAPDNCPAFFVGAGQDIDFLMNMSSITDGHLGSFRADGTCTLRVERDIIVGSSSSSFSTCFNWRDGNDALIDIFVGGVIDATAMSSSTSGVFSCLNNQGEYTETTIVADIECGATAFASGVFKMESRNFGRRLKWTGKCNGTNASTRFFRYTGNSSGFTNDVQVELIGEVNIPSYLWVSTNPGPVTVFADVTHTTAMTSTDRHFYNSGAGLLTLYINGSYESDSAPLIESTVATGKNIKAYIDDVSVKYTTLNSEVFKADNATEQVGDIIMRGNFRCNTTADPTYDAADWNVEAFPDIFGGAAGAASTLEEVLAAGNKSNINNQFMTDKDRIGFVSFGDPDSSYQAYSIKHATNSDHTYLRGVNGGLTIGFDTDGTINPLFHIDDEGTVQSFATEFNVGNSATNWFQQVSSSSDFRYWNSSNYTSLNFGSPSAQHTITVPNATGTMALISDIPSVSTPDLQAVTTEGNTTTNSILLQRATNHNVIDIGAVQGGGTTWFPEIKLRTVISDVSGPLQENVTITAQNISLNESDTPSDGRVTFYPTFFSFIPVGGSNTNVNWEDLLTDAPSDGTTYGRNNGAWVAAGGSTPNLQAVLDEGSSALIDTTFQVIFDDLANPYADLSVGNNQAYFQVFDQFGIGGGLVTVTSTDVNINAYNSTTQRDVGIILNAANGQLDLYAQGNASPNTPRIGMLFDPANRPSEIRLDLWESNGDVSNASLDFSGLTNGADRTYTFQDASGTLAFLTDIPSSLSGSFGVPAYPNDGNTYALTEFNNTISWTDTSTFGGGTTPNKQAVFTEGSTFIVMNQSITNTVQNASATVISNSISNTGAGLAYHEMSSFNQYLQFSDLSTNDNVYVELENTYVELRATEFGADTIRFTMYNDSRDYFEFTKGTNSLRFDIDALTADRNLYWGNFDHDFRTPNNDDVLTFTGGIAQWAAPSGGGGGASVSYTWQYSSTTTSGDPGAGNFRLNNADSSLVTALYVSNESKNGVDLSVVLNALDNGDQIYIQNNEDSNESALYTVSSVVDNTTWFGIVVTHVDSGSDTSWTDGKEFGTVLFALGTSSPVTELYYNIMDYGAVGDGVTSDQTAFDNALAAIPAEGGTLYFPNGTYLIDSIAFINRDNVRLLGESRENSIILNTTSGQNGVQISGYRRVGWQTAIGDVAPYTDTMDVGQHTVTLQDVADAAKFTVGDKIFIAAGSSLQFDQEYGEFNRIIGISGAVLTLEKPLARDYRTEYATWNAELASDFTPVAVGVSTTMSVNMKTVNGEPNPGVIAGISLGNEFYEFVSSDYVTDDPVSNPYTWTVISRGTNNQVGGTIPAGTKIYKQRVIIRTPQTWSGTVIENLTIEANGDTINLSNSMDTLIRDVNLVRQSGAGGLWADFDDGRNARFENCKIIQEDRWDACQPARSFGELVFDNCEFFNAAIDWSEFCFDGSVINSRFYMSNPTAESNTYVISLGWSTTNMTVKGNMIYSEDVDSLIDIEPDINGSRGAFRGGFIIKDNKLHAKNAERFIRVNQAGNTEIAGNYMYGDAVALFAATGYTTGDANTDGTRAISNGDDIFINSSSVNIHHNHFAGKIDTINILKPTNLIMEDNYFHWHDFNDVVSSNFNNGSIIWRNGTNSFGEIEILRVRRNIFKNWPYADGTVTGGGTPQPSFNIDPTDGAYLDNPNTERVDISDNLFLNPQQTYINVTSDLSGLEEFNIDHYTKHVARTVEISQVDYDALSVKNPYILYVITS